MNNHFDHEPKATSVSNLSMLTAFAVMIIFLLCLTNSDIKDDPGGAKQLSLYEYKTAEQLVAKVDQLEATIPGRVNPEDFYPWQAQIRVAQNAVEDFRTYGLIQEPQAIALLNRAKAVESAAIEVAELNRFSVASTQPAQEKLYYPVMNAARPPVNRWNILPWLGLAYSISGCLVFLLMCYKAHKRGYRLLAEFLTPTRLPLAVTFWFITVWKYPFGSPLQSLQKTLRLGTYALATIMSFSAAGAKVFGQGSSKKSAKDKPTPEWTAQADARYGEVVNGTGPEPQRSLRVTVTSPHGWVSEDIFGSKNLQWNAYITAGKILLKSPRTTIIGVGGFRLTHDKIHNTNDASVIGGLQVYNAFTLPKKFPGFSALNTNTPVINFERSVRGSPANRHLNFTVVNQTFLKSKRWNLFPGWETVVSKTASKPIGWTVGPLLEWKFSKKAWPRFGIGYLFNQNGTGVLRFRLIENIAF
ncbi:MAG TPA: hypothetical protein VHQ41_02460 [Patescibacteria group bacterium]|nr:hypothetical protein [Patescibacteria group bacterium]